MKYERTAIKDIGFVHEDSFEAMLIRNGIEYTKVEDVPVYDFGVYGGKDFNFYDYKRGNGQRVLVCTTFVSIVDDFMEEMYLFNLEDDEEYTIDQVKELLLDILHIEEYGYGRGVRD